MSFLLRVALSPLYHVILQAVGVWALDCELYEAASPLWTAWWSERMALSMIRLGDGAVAVLNSATAWGHRVVST